ncbi:hypothetical protein GQX73_g255 [Xylaria multiplex]|uniref:Uncharacterized protein n=1 Tax=Xylaria multiplex TaxID=323545 RepID=A0A7C8NDW8_9PEZI|nr:hypothetical protein GQX73_g255 [Xylaria multiplex]
MSARNDNDKAGEKTDGKSTNSNNTITAKAKARAHDLLVYSQRQVDRIVTPSTRQKAIDSTTAFATKRPLLSLFIATQILTALVPTLLFTTFILSALIFALLSTIAFTLFWTLVALFFLLPTLLLTSGFAVLIWLWAVGSYFVARAIYLRLPDSTRQTFSPNGGKHIIFNNQSYDFDEAITTEISEARE